MAVNVTKLRLREEKKTLKETSGGSEREAIEERRTERVGGKRERERRDMKIKSIKKGISIGKRMGAIPPERGGRLVLP